MTGIRELLRNLVMRFLFRLGLTKREARGQEIHLTVFLLAIH